ncbi:MULTISPECIES: PBS lyase [Pseudomonas]|uniref:PBS lyase n=2 Tax=Pseudomonas TaxID=286 RepID=UPI000C881279|nr:MULTISPECIES: PBS lyase [Pseudomonas]PMY37257.1 PBS lyase [Pseudomonas sp. FW306-2-2C-D06C]PYC41859.1 PBS lyase [Pseudomonas chlororaphis]UQS92688.1 PBS lyase [Pseudomonas chlororaphis subsp. piscium]
MDDMDALIAAPPSWHDQLSDYEARRVREVMDTLDRHSAWLELSRFGNGFVRQAAVRGLAAQPSAEALAALLERLNDWVPQVRQEAAAAVEAYWAPEHAGLLLQTLAPLLALTSKQRADHGATLERATAVLQLAQVRDEVQGAFGDCRGKAARFVFELLLKGVEDRPALLAMALRHPEVSVRQMAVDACAELPDEQAVPLLEEVMRRCGASVRVKALRLLLPLLADPGAHLRQALLDPSVALRCLARWAAPRHRLDPREVLLARLLEPAPLNKREWLGLLGLAKELQEPQADAMLQQALASKALTVRLLALQALGERGLAQQLAALDDPSDKVFDCALGLLREQPWAAFEETLEQRLDQHWHGLPKARRWALLGLKPGWRQLEYLLHRLDQAGSEAAYWREALARWCDARYAMFDPVTPKPLREALAQRLQAMEEAGDVPRGSVKRLL